MYITCHNSRKVDPNLKNNTELVFGKKSYPISFTVAERSCAKITQPRKSFEFSECSETIAKSVIDFLYGQEIQINEQNVEELLNISIQMGIIEIIESCDMLKKALNKINTALDRLINNQIDNSLLDYVSRFFHIFTLYDKFLSISPKLLEAILSRKFLGIHSESDLFKFLMKYQQRIKKNNPNDTDSNRLFQRINYQGFTSSERSDLFDKYPEIFDEMVGTGNQSYSQRVLIAKPDSSKGFRSILTQMINTSF